MSSASDLRVRFESVLSSVSYAARKEIFFSFSLRGPTQIDETIH